MPGLAVNRHCAAGQAAVQSAAASIRAGMDQLILAGGVNSASTSPRFKRRAGSPDDEMVDWFPPTHPNRPDAPNMDMSITVGWNAAVKAGVSREEMDEWALGSHRKAIQAIDEGRFKHEIVPIETPHGLFDVDEHPRRDTSLREAGQRSSRCIPRSKGFRSPRAMPAAPTTARRCWRSRAIVWACPPWRPSGRGHPSASIRPPPVSHPSRRSRKRLPALGFRSPTSTCSRSTRHSRRCAWPPSSFSTSIRSKVNVSGSGCSLGHPVAATGARMLVTLVHELRRRGGGIGVAAMCAGGGMGSATVIEVPAP